MTYKGILFDFDGTLVQSMEDHFNAWQEALRKYSVDLKKEDYYPLEGTSVRKLAEIFLPKTVQSTIMIEQLIQEKEAIFKRIHQFNVYPGVHEILDLLLNSKVPFGIVTAGLKARIQQTTPAQFLNRFQTMITGDMVKLGKPHPEPYIKGAESLRLPPQECIVIENAPLGIKAGKAAGCFSIAVCSTVGSEHFPHADAIVPSILALQQNEHIKNLLK